MYLEQCIKECLRLHPPAEVSVRHSPQSNVTVDGLFIPKRKSQKFKMALILPLAYRGKI